jgi:hypothetical protein
MTRDHLIEAVVAEMERIWGKTVFDGTAAEYEWLLSSYGITEEEGVQWQLLLQYQMQDLSDEDREDPEVTDFVENKAAAVEFLVTLLRKYQNSSARYRDEFSAI